MRQSESLASFAKAFVKVQAALKPAAKDSMNPHFKSRYADLASVWDACREPLTANGFCIIQPAEKVDGKIRVITRLMHESGEFIESEIEMTPMDARPQSDGSEITYARRYALAAMVGVCPDDDDGNDASGHREPQQPQRQQSPKPKPKAEPPADKRSEVNDTIPINGTNAVYQSYRVRFGNLITSEAGKTAWPNGQAELKAWAVTAKGHSFKSWADVETCIDSQQLEKLWDVVAEETARRANEKAPKEKREPVGAY